METREEREREKERERERTREGGREEMDGTDGREGELVGGYGGSESHQ